MAKELVTRGLFTGTGTVANSPSSPPSRTSATSASGRIVDAIDERYAAEDRRSFFAEGIPLPSLRSDGLAKASNTCQICPVAALALPVAVVAVLVAIHCGPCEFRGGQMPRSELCRASANCLAADS